MRSTSPVLIEMLVHGWDLATATGRPTDLAPDVAEAILPAVRAVYGDLPRTPGGSFAPAQEGSSRHEPSRPPRRLPGPSHRLIGSFVKPSWAAIPVRIIWEGAHMAKAVGVRDVAGLVAVAERGERIKYLTFWGHQPPLSSREARVVAEVEPARVRAHGGTADASAHVTVGRRAEALPGSQVG